MKFKMETTFKKIVFLALFFSAVIPCYGETTLLTEINNYLKEQHLAPVEVIKSSTSVSMQFCPPDRDCDFIKFPSNTPEDQIDDFTFLYFYYVSRYKRWDKFILHRGKELAPPILERYKGNCPDKEEFELASCILLNRLKKKWIEIAPLQYGKSKDSVVAPEDLLSAEALRSKRAFAKGEIY